MIHKIKIVIIDYGVGNLYSLVRAFKFFGIEAVVTEEVKVLKQADGIVLPGVGSFAAGMRGLEMRGLIEKVKEMAGENKPMLGICLGAQIMLTEGHEFGIFKGLDIISGRVVLFPVLKDKEKVPQVGWNTISPSKENSWDGTILDSFTENDQVYFVHSYILEPESKKNILALTTYGGHTFCSVIKKGNIYGCQFHPEKSGRVGLKIIENFINLVKQEPC
ncbi:MAG: imidazole glycerol phosphate synthase subunit HisH [Patescibacteria group bacterium]|nr:imidazole glycerol phosphate synthase subunit HisH [Patescibacteria group bacterium]